MLGKYKAYPEYKDSGVEWLGEIPSNWEVTRHKYVAAFKKGKNPEFLLDDFEDGAVRYLSMDYLRGGSTSLYALPERSSYLAQKDQVLIIWDGSNSGEFVKGEVGIVSSTMAAAEYLVNINKGFYWYLCRCLEPEMRRHATGMGIPHVNGTELKNSIIVLPTDKEQEKIASFLDHETAKIDTLIYKQQQLIQLLKEKRQAVISHAVTKGLNPNAPMRDSGVEWLGEVPKHWEKSKIKFIAELTPRKIEVAAYKDSTCSFIPMEKLKKDLLILDEIRNVSEVFDGYTYFRDEDLLVAKVTPCFENKNMVVARGLLNGIGFGSSEIYVLRAQINNLNDFLYYRLQEDVFMEMATSEMTGAGGLRRVPSEFLSNFQLALPPEKERLEIVDFIKDYVSKFDMLMRLAEEEINLMQERRTALISAAVTGKIDVTNWQSPEPSDNQNKEVFA